jgi:hypothetical protein
MKSPRLFESHRRFRNSLRPFALVALFTATLLLATFDGAERRASAQEEQEIATANVNAANQIPSNSTVRGRVVYEDTGLPVRRVGLLILRTDGASNARGEYSATTNTRGEFMLGGLAAGTYIAAVNAPGVVSPLAYMMFAREGSPLRSNSMANLFDVDEVRQNFEQFTVDGTNNATLTVRARRGGAISGRVTYSDGGPAINVQINILRRNQNNEFVPFVSGFTLFSMIQRTDDRGMYRIAGLPPGEYAINVSEMNTRSINSEGEREGEMMMIFGGMGDALVTTYYGNTTNLADARSIRVTPGSESSEINISLIEPNAFEVSGRVTARGGNQPVPDAQVFIRAQDTQAPPSIMALMARGAMGGHTTRTDEQGRWSFPEVPEGNYTVTVEPPARINTEETEIVTNLNSNTPPPRRTQRPPQLPRERHLTRREQTVRVAGADVTNLTIDLLAGGRISGTVSVEGGETFPEYGAFIQLEQTGGGAAAAAIENNVMRHVDQGGNFVIDGLPNGAFYLNVSGSMFMNPDNGFYVKTITSPNGGDLMREPVVVTGETDLQNIRIVLARGRPTVTGRVLDASGEATRGAIVMLVPSDERQWGRPSTRHYGQTDWQGNFTISAPPGDYLLFAARTNRAIILDANGIRANLSRAVRVTLAQNQRRNIDVNQLLGN